MELRASQSERPAWWRNASVWWAILIALWCLELLAVQEYTAAPAGLSEAIAAKYALRRLWLCASGCLFLVCFLNRFWLYAVFAAGFLTSNIVVVCAHYFETPLSWFMIRDQWREGLAVADHGLTLICRPAFLWLAIGLAIKIALCEAACRARASSAISRRRLAPVAAAVYLVSAVVLAGIYKPVTQLKFASPPYAYGYLIGWAAESFCYDEEGFLQLAQAAAEEETDRLSAVESPLPWTDRIAIVQVESLDFDTIDARCEGRWVMPFLHSLKESAMVFAATPDHATGTSDSDFTVLVKAKPNGRIAPYKVRGFHYRSALPQLARQQGYHTVSLHGYMGGFFGRRPAFEEMGFAEIYFAEELRQMGLGKPDGVVDDDEVLQLSAQWMRSATNPTLHMIITMSSHGPYQRVPPEKRELIPNPASKVDNYFNSMRFVDGALRDYVDAVPDGTTLVIYGDHGTELSGYSSPGEPRRKRVPWLFYCKGENLAARQRARGAEWTCSGDLTMLDLATYVHRGLEPARVARRPNESRRENSAGVY
jgi:phosphoglycerol transferase MdoB-like AlkP superfamily enzyme